MSKIFDSRPHGSQESQAGNNLGKKLKRKSEDYSSLELIRKIAYKTTADCVLKPGVKNHFKTVKNVNLFSKLNNQNYAKSKKRNWDSSSDEDWPTQASWKKTKVKDGLDYEDITFDEIIESFKKRSQVEDERVMQIYTSLNTNRKKDSLFQKILPNLKNSKTYVPINYCSNTNSNFPTEENNTNTNIETISPNYEPLKFKVVQEKPNQCAETIELHRSNIDLRTFSTSSDSSGSDETNVSTTVIPDSDVPFISDEHLNVETDIPSKFKDCIKSKLIIGISENQNCNKDNTADLNSNNNKTEYTRDKKNKTKSTNISENLNVQKSNYKINSVLSDVSESDELSVSVKNVNDGFEREKTPTFEEIIESIKKANAKNEFSKTHRFNTQVEEDLERKTINIPNSDNKHISSNQTPGIKKSIHDIFLKNALTNNSTENFNFKTIYPESRKQKRNQVLSEVSTITSQYEDIDKSKTCHSYENYTHEDDLNEDTNFEDIIEYLKSSKLRKESPKIEGIHTQIVDELGEETIKTPIANNHDYVSLCKIPKRNNILLNTFKNNPIMNLQKPNLKLNDYLSDESESDKTNVFIFGSSEKKILLNSVDSDETYISEDFNDITHMSEINLNVDNAIPQCHKNVLPDAFKSDEGRISEENSNFKTTSLQNECIQKSNVNEGENYKLLISDFQARNPLFEKISKTSNTKSQTIEEHVNADISLKKKQFQTQNISRVANFSLTSDLGDRYLKKSTRETVTPNNLENLNMIKKCRTATTMLDKSVNVKKSFSEKKIKDKTLFSKNFSQSQTGENENCDLKLSNLESRQSLEKHMNVIESSHPQTMNKSNINAKEITPREMKDDMANKCFPSDSDEDYNFFKANFKCVISESQQLLQKNVEDSSRLKQKKIMKYTCVNNLYSQHDSSIKEKITQKTQNGNILACNLKKNKNSFTKKINNTVENLLKDETLNSILTEEYERFMKRKEMEDSLTQSKLMEDTSKKEHEKSCHVKRFRKGRMKIYRLKKLKKTADAASQRSEGSNIEDIFKQLTQNFIEPESKLPRSPTCSSVSTSSSYVSDDVLSETFSTGSQELSTPQQRLRIGLNELLKDKTLFCKDLDNLECDRHEIKIKIRKIFLKVFNDLTNGRVSVLRFRKQCLENCILKDGRLQFKTKNVEMAEINTKNEKFQERFKLVLLIMKKVQTLLETNTKITKRELYYQMKDMVSNQGAVDRAINTISCILDVGMWSLNIVAQKGLVFGDLKIVLSNGETINCKIPGTQIPPDIKQIIEFQTTAYFILVVEKESIFYKLIEEDLPGKLTRPFIMITGKGFPDLNTQLFLRKLWAIMSIPVFILVDADPDGVQIMLNYRFGSIKNAHVSQHLAVPNAKWLGIYPSEIKSFDVKTQPLTHRELKLAQSLLRTPYMSTNPGLASEISVMLENKFKAGIETLIMSQTFLSEVYFPQKFYSHKFL